MRTKAETILLNVTNTENGDISARLYNFANLLKKEKGSLSAASVGDALEKLVRWSTPFEYQKAVSNIQNEYYKKMREYDRTRDEIYEEVRESVEDEIKREHAGDFEELEILRKWKDENEWKVDAFDGINSEIYEELEAARSREWNILQVGNVAESIRAAGRGEW